PATKHAEARADALRERAPRRVRLGDDGGQLVAELLDAVERDREVQRLLAREVPVERPLADAARGRDVVHLHLRVVAPPEHPLARGKDGFTKAGGGGTAAD